LNESLEYSEGEALVLQEGLLPEGEQCDALAAIAKQWS
jgi:hypothetical protein